MIDFTVLLILVSIIIIIKYWRKRKSIKQIEQKKEKNKFLLNLSEVFNCSIIKIIKPPKGYENEIFFPNDPENNPSIYSKKYGDFGLPLKLSSLDELKKEANSIYQIPEKYKNCLGGANLMIFSSCAAKNQSKSNEYKLYCPLFFGFYRNQSSKSLFNLVKTGKISMKPFSVHSPATTILTNNTNVTVSINIPKGTILEGTNGNQAPIQTTDHYSINIPLKSSLNIQLEYRPLNFLNEYLKLLELKLEFERKGYVYGFHNFGDDPSVDFNITGDYLLTSFIIPEIDEELLKPLPKDPSTLCAVHDSCEILNTEFKDKKVKRMCIAKIPVLFFKEREGENLKYIIHEAVVMEFESGECLVVEKFGPNFSASSTNRGKADPKGQIETHKCKVSGDEVLVHGETYKIMDDSQWRNIDSNLTGEEIYARIQSSPKYDLETTNCQHFARTTFPEAHFSPQKAQGDELIKRSKREVINHAGFCKEIDEEVQHALARFPRWTYN